MKEKKIDLGCLILQQIKKTNDNKFLPYQNEDKFLPYWNASPGKAEEEISCLRPTLRGEILLKRVVRRVVGRLKLQVKQQLYMFKIGKKLVISIENYQMQFYIEKKYNCK